MNYIQVGTSLNRSLQFLRKLQKTVVSAIDVKNGIGRDFSGNQPKKPNSLIKIKCLLPVRASSPCCHCSPAPQHAQEGKVLASGTAQRAAAKILAVPLRHSAHQCRGVGPHKDSQQSRWQAPPYPSCPRGLSTNQR